MLEELTLKVIQIMPQNALSDVRTSLLIVDRRAVSFPDRFAHAHSLHNASSDEVERVV